MKAFREWTKRTYLTKNFVVHSRNAWLAYKGTTMIMIQSTITDKAGCAFGPNGNPDTPCAERNESTVALRASCSYSNPL